MGRNIQHPSFKVPMLTWWEGVYDHIFIALHPFYRIRKRAPDDDANGSPYENVIADEDELDDFDDTVKARGEVVSWHSVHMAVAPDTPMIEFYRAVWLLSVVGFQERANPALQEQIHTYCMREKLHLPYDGGLPAILHLPMHQFLSCFGDIRVTAWDEFREHSIELPLTSLAPDQPTAFLPESTTSSDLWALHLRDPELLVTSEFDGTESMIAMTGKALRVARPEDFFEGLYAQSDTYSDWLNPRDFFERDE